MVVVAVVVVVVFQYRVLSKPKGLRQWWKCFWVVTVLTDLVEELVVGFGDRVVDGGVGRGCLSGFWNKDEKYRINFSLLVRFEERERERPIIKILLRNMFSIPCIDLNWVLRTSIVFISMVELSRALFPLEFIFKYPIESRSKYITHSLTHSLTHSHTHSLHDWRSGKKTPNRIYSPYWTNPQFIENKDTTNVKMKQIEWR